MPINLARVLNLPVIDCQSSDVKLPNGNILSASQYVRVKCTYELTNKSEVIKLYLLPITNSIILGGDWLVGNNVSINYDSCTLTHRGLGKLQRLKIYNVCVN